MARRSGSRGPSGRRGSSRTKDQFGAKARADGYPARSVYKLEEIDRRTQLLRRGQAVLDLGAFPGSWSMFAAKKVGSKGTVLAVDLQPFDAPLAPNIETARADLRELEPLFEVGGLLHGRPFDVVLSDMAPSTTGQRQLDMYRSFDLAMNALEVARRALADGGAFVAKIFQGAEFPQAHKAVKDQFARVRVLRPEATRSQSYEVFLVGIGSKGSEPRGSEPGEVE